MKKSDYLKDKDVISFLDWLSTRLDVSGSINHQYTNRKTNKPWACDCLYDAYEKYKWPFSFNDLHGAKQKEIALQRIPYNSNIFANVYSLLMQR
ncbi:MAG: hypothetical protein IPM78_10945 [Moraxellaceae bacterium]|nr:hypothetical protein [Moraxellaceae bacterium]